MPEGPSSPESTSPTFRTTLVRVIVVQIVALGMLWLLQARYNVF